MSVKWTQQLEAELRQIVAQYQSQGMTENAAVVEAAKMLKLEYSSAYQKNRKLVLAESIGETENHEPEHPEPEPESVNTVSIEKDGTIVSDRLIEITEDELKDVTALLLHHGYDPDKWTLIESTSNFWHGARPHDRGLRVHCQSKIRVKPKERSGLDKETIDGWFDAMGKKSPASPAMFANPVRKGAELEVTITDVHVGGDNNQDVGERFRQTILQIANKASNAKVSKITVAQIGDMLQYDSADKKTANGTPQNSPLDFPPMFNAAADLLIFALETLSQVADVEMKNIPGNHDRLTGYALGKAIEFYMRRDRRVVVDADYSNPWKYKMFFDNLVMWTHGDMNKNNLKSLLHREARKEYGRSKHAEIHIGHWHHEKTIEGDGVTLRYLASMSHPDGWHQRSGYTGQRENMTCFVWTPDGLDEVWYPG